MTSKLENNLSFKEKIDSGYAFLIIAISSESGNRITARGDVDIS